MLKTYNDDYDRFDDKIPAKIDISKAQNIQIDNIPVINAEFKSVSFEEDFFVQDVTCMVNVGNELWVGVKGLFKYPELAQGSTIMSYDMDKGKSFDLSHRLGKHSIATSMHLDRNILWLTFSSDGVWAVDTQTFRAKRYETRDGLTSNEIYSSCAYGEKLYFGGGRIEQEASLCSFDKKTRKWTGYGVPKVMWFGKQINVPRITSIKANRKWLVAYASYGGIRTTLMIFDFAKRNWTEAASDLLREHPEFSHFSEGKRLKIKDIVIDDKGIWIGTSQGLVMFSPETMQYDYLGKLPFGVSSIIDVGDYLWLGCTLNPNGSRYNNKSVMKGHIILFDKKTRKYVSQIQLPYKGAVSEMVLIDNSLWVGISGNRKNTLVSIDLKAFKKR